MRKRYYSLHLISDGKGKPKRLSFSATSLRILVAAVALFPVAVLVFVIWALPKVSQHDKVLAENQELIQDRLKVTKILGDYNRILQMDQYIRSVLGAELTLPPMDSVSLDSFSVPLGVNIHPEKQALNVSYLDNIPIFPPVNGYITQGFINDHIFTDKNHYGLDVAAVEGAPIKAAAAGVVIFANWVSHYGYTVILSHSNGYFTVYGHNQRNLVEEHQLVERGQVIGLVGDTGISDGPHLHFEIWKNGTPIDPESMIYSYRHSDISTQ